MVKNGANFYRVVEMMILPNGNIGEQNPWNYENLEDAEARYFGILGEAVKSEVPFHGAYILSSEGSCEESRVFDRRNNGWYWDESESIWKKGTPETTEAAE